MAAKKRRGRRQVGVGVDASGGPVIDPTQNVLDLVQAAIQRQDDLREAESRHLREMAQVRDQHAKELRRSEADRIDAIRAVDVGAVQRAAEVSTQQATTLANQVATSAEALRAAVAAAAQAQAVALAAALDPLQVAIADLRRVQYEAVGGKQNVTEAREVRTDTRSEKAEQRLNMNVLIGALGLILAVVIYVIGK